MLVGIVSFVASLFSTQFVRCFGRKTLLLWGHLTIAIIHSAVSIFNMQGLETGVVIMTMTFMIPYQLTTGPITYIYATETIIDAGMGIVMPALFGTIFVLSLVCPIIIDPNNLGPNATFFILSGLSFAGFLYVLLFMKETFGKSDKEKKLLYTPARFLDEKDEALM